MFSGWVHKRTTPISPPAMQRVYSVLWGTLLLDFDSEEEARCSLSPRLCVEVLGVSEWDGKGRATNYAFGFLLVTHTGSTFYVSVPTMQERDEWVLQLKRSLECVFANPEVVPFKPSKIVASRTAPVLNPACPVTGNAIVRGAGVLCACCGLAHYSADLVAEGSTLLQVGAEDAERVCLSCRNAQAVILWLKSMNYVHTMALHESTPAVLQQIGKFKASFRLRRRLSPRLEQAADLLEDGKITVPEFEELRVVDHNYRRELEHDEKSKLKGAVDAFGDDMQTILDVILNSALIDKGGRASQVAVILKVLDVADRSPDIVDFYMPQLLQTHLILSEERSVSAMVKLDLFQQALLVVAQRYPAIAFKLCWGLLATVADYQEKKCSQVQYCSCVVLLLQLEMVMTGYVSSIADVPSSELLSGVMCAAMHQQQEVGYEIGVLFLVRRRLQEVNDVEERARLEHSGRVDRAAQLQREREQLYSEQRRDMESGAPGTPVSPSRATQPLTTEQTGVDIGAGIQSILAERSIQADASTEIAAEAQGGAGRPTAVLSCLQLFYQLGVGQSHMSRFSDDFSSDDGGEGVGDQAEMGGSGSNPAVAYKDIVHAYKGFSAFTEQLDFVHRLNTLVEKLRFVDRAIRTKTLADEAEKWNETPSDLGWDPTTVAAEPFYRIMKVVVGDCRVFRTKARAPTMLVCEVLRDDLVPYYIDSLKYSAGAGAKAGVGTGTRTEAGAEEGAGIGARAREGRSGGSGSTIEDGAREGVGEGMGPVSTGVTVSPQLSRKERQTVVAHVVNHAPGKGTVEGDEGIFSLGANGHGHGHVGSAGIAAEIGREIEARGVGNMGGGNGDREREKERFETVSRDILHVPNLLVTAGGESIACKQGGGDVSDALPVRAEHTPPGSVALPDHKPTPIQPVSTGSLESIGEAVEDASGAGTWRTVQAPMGDYHVHGRLCSTDLGDRSPGSSSRAPIPRQAVHAVLSSNRLSVKPNSELMGRGGPVSGERDVKGMRMSESGVFKPSEEADAGSGSEDPLIDGSKCVAPLVLDPVTGRTGTSMVTKKVLTSAQRLLANGLIDPLEYELLIASDQNFQHETAREEAAVAKTRVEDAFGESWQNKRERLLGDRLYMFGYPSEDVWPGWDLRAFILKSNDDLRQEVSCLQVMQIFKEVFEHFGLQEQLFLRPYRIFSTGNSTGLVQVLEDAMSLDALKKTAGFTTLDAYFRRTYDSSAERLNAAKTNFASSLAAYSLFSYLLLVKDRHNGNLMIDSEGHIIHIDFGFLLSIAPGGAFSLETAPFKLTEEMVEVLGGLDSALFGEFLTAFTKGFIALQSNAENIIQALQVLSRNSSFPCFQGKQASVIIDKLRGRFRTELGVNDAVKHCLDLITNSYGHYGTRQYDTFQWITNGIMP